MTKTELFFVKLNAIHNSTCSTLVILGLGNSLSSKNIVSGLELRVKHLVGEALAANGNTSKHTIALVLMHDEAWLNTSGLLVSVGDNTTDEVRLSLIQDTHEVIKLTLEV